MEDFGYAIYFILVIGVSIQASSYGRSFWGYFLLSALVTPLISFFILLAAGKTAEQKFYEQNTM